MSQSFDNREVSTLPIGSTGENIASSTPERSLYTQKVSEALQRPSFKALFDLMNNMPEYRAIRRTLIGHAEDLRNTSFDKDSTALNRSPDAERASHLVPLICLAARDRNLRPLLEYAIDRESHLESERIKQSLKSGTCFVPQVVIGAGVHGAVF